MNKEKIEIEQFIYKEDEATGEIVAELNPEYQKFLQQRNYEFYLEYSGILPEYYNIDFKDYRGDKKSKEYKRITYYADNFEKEEFKYIHLYLWGNSGCQKTALECNILKAGIRRGLKVKFIQASALISKLMKIQGYGADREITSKIYKELEELKSCDIVGIDDIGAEIQWKNNKLIISEWDQLLRELVSSKTRVIITSNYDKTQVEEEYDKRFFELIDRNFVDLHLTYSVKENKKFNMNNVFEKVGL